MAQKRDIFYSNAARFLRLSEEEIARHHAAGGAKRRETARSALRDNAGFSRLGRIARAEHRSGQLGVLLAKRLHLFLGGLAMKRLQAIPSREHGVALVAR